MSFILNLMQRYKTFPSDHPSITYPDTRCMVQLCPSDPLQSTPQGFGVQEACSATGRVADLCLDPCCDTGASGGALIFLLNWIWMRSGVES